MTTLTEEDVIWITNDIAELGVRIGNQCFFLYKGDSITYDDKPRENGTPMMIRTVGKREFGECAHPINYGDYTKKGTVSLGDSDRWEEMPGQQRVDDVPFKSRRTAQHNQEPTK